MLIHIDQVDYAGHHEGGPVDPRWDAAARRADDLLAEIAATLDLSKDTLFVASDHGQIDRGGHGGQDPITLVEPWVLAGAGVQPGRYGDVEQVDVAPTLAALLGVNIPASAQGRVRTEMLALAPEQTAAIETSGRRSAGRAGAGVRAGHRAAGVPWSPVRDVVAATQAAMDAARDGAAARGAPAQGHSGPCPGVAAGRASSSCGAGGRWRGCWPGARAMSWRCFNLRYADAGWPDVFAQLGDQFGGPDCVRGDHRTDRVRRELGGDGVSLADLPGRTGAGSQPDRSR